MEMSEDIMEKVAGVCQHVQQLLSSYEEGREPDKLDCHVFHIDRLYRILLALNIATAVWRLLVQACLYLRNSTDHKVQDMP